MGRDEIVECGDEWGGECESACAGVCRIRSHSSSKMAGRDDAILEMHSTLFEILLKSTKQRLAVNLRTSYARLGALMPQVLHSTAV